MEPEPAVQLYALAYPVTSLGPGRRVALWVAGCGRGCPGCISPEMQPVDAGRPVTAERLAGRLLRLDAGLEGLTVSGGEPFDQAAALSEVVVRVRRARPEWSVIVYSGYTLAEIRRDSSRHALLGLVDVLVDGAYLRDVPGRALAGSGNQIFHYLTTRGLSLREAMEGATPGAANIGLGRGLLNMIIGVTDDTNRSAIRRALGLPADGE